MVTTHNGGRMNIKPGSHFFDRGIHLNLSGEGRKGAARDEREKA